MRAKKFFAALIFIFMLTEILYADEWQADKLDARRAIPNNATPPDRLEPVCKLVPLKNDEGVIRRVNVRDGERRRKKSLPILIWK